VTSECLRSSMLSLMLARRGLVQQKSVHLHHSKLWHSKQLSRMPDSAKSASIWHMQRSAETPAGSRSNTACCREVLQLSIQHNRTQSSKVILMPLPTQGGCTCTKKEKYKKTTPFGDKFLRSQVLFAPVHRHQLALQQQLAQTS